MKMKKTLHIGLFSCIALIQIAVPVWMIAHREMTLHNGRQFRFRTAPVDPHDAFRGRYVALSIENNKAPVAGSVKLIPNQKVYANIEEDDQGFARIVSITVDRPKGDAYIQTEVDHVQDNEVYFRLPFDRYYMDEKAAPAAEVAYQKYSGRVDAYVTVRVKSGFAVIEELYVGGKPVLEFVQERRNQQPASNSPN